MNIILMMRNDNNMYLIARFISSIIFFFLVWFSLSRARTYRPPHYFSFHFFHYDLLAIQKVNTFNNIILHKFLSIVFIASSLFYNGESTRTAVQLKSPEEKKNRSYHVSAPHSYVSSTRFAYILTRSPVNLHEYTCKLCP